jgi:hypothetical protein
MTHPARRRMTATLGGKKVQEADMEPANNGAGERPAAPFGWAPVLAGALIAAALAAVLLAFGSALGLGVASAAPTWRDASVALSLLGGIYLLLVALAAFSVGGYVAGRLRGRSGLYPQEPEFYAGLRGLLTWAAAVILILLLTMLSAPAFRPAGEPVGGNAGPARSLAGETLIGFELDRLFRAERRPADVDLTYPRAEAGRILLTSAGHAGVASDDRAYLATLVRNATGLAAPDAERRVATAIARASEAIARARRAAVLLGFMTAVSLLVGAVACWLASERGERDGQGLDRSAFLALFDAPARAAARDGGGIASGRPAADGADPLRRRDP